MRKAKVTGPGTGMQGVDVCVGVCVGSAQDKGARAGGVEELKIKQNDHRIEKQYLFSLCVCYKLYPDLCLHFVVLYNSKTLEPYREANILSCTTRKRFSDVHRDITRHGHLIEAVHPLPPAQSSTSPCDRR